MHQSNLEDHVETEMRFSIECAGCGCIKEDSESCSGMDTYYFDSFMRNLEKAGWEVNEAGDPMCGSCVEDIDE